LKVEKEEFMSLLAQKEAHAVRREGGRDGRSTHIYIYIYIFTPSLPPSLPPSLLQSLLEAKLGEERRRVKEANDLAWAREEEKRDGEYERKGMMEEVREGGRGGRGGEGGRMMEVVREGGREGGEVVGSREICVSFLRARRARSDHEDYCYSFYSHPSFLPSLPPSLSP
jgi:hypothetical protein